MKARRSRTLLLLLVLLLAPVASAQAWGEELINRREQSRRAFLSTPEGIYHHYCGHCHGEDGKGSGSHWVSALKPLPADLTALDKDESYLIEAISKGSGSHGKSALCPPWGKTLSEARIKRLVRYILELGGKLPEPTPADKDELETIGESFPWLALLAVLAECVLVGWLIRRRRSSAASVPGAREIKKKKPELQDESEPEPGSAEKSGRSDPPR